MAAPSLRSFVSWSWGGATATGDRTFASYSSDIAVGDRALLTLTCLGTGTPPTVSDPASSLTWTMVVGETVSANHHSVWISSPITNLATEGFNVTTGGTGFFNFNSWAFDGVYAVGTAVLDTEEEVNAAGDTTLAPVTSAMTDCLLLGGVAMHGLSYIPHTGLVAADPAIDAPGSLDDNMLLYGGVAGFSVGYLQKPNPGTTGNFTYITNDPSTPGDTDSLPSWAFMALLQGEDSVLGLTQGGGIASGAIGGGTIGSDQALTGGGAIASTASVGIGVIGAELVLTGGGGIDSGGVGGGGVGSAAVGELGIAPPVGSIQEAMAIRWAEPGVSPFRYGPEFEVFATLRDYGDGETYDQRLFQYDNLEVIHPLNDSRTASLRAPIEDFNALSQSNIEVMLPLEYMIKILYRGRLVFWGPILKPIFNFAEGHVELNCHDMTYYLKRHFVHSWDVNLLADNGNLPVSPASMWKLVQAAAPSFHDDALFESVAAPLGERVGTLGGLAAVAGDSIEVQRGMNIWDLLYGMAWDHVRASDFNFKPIDEHRNDGWEPGQMFEFGTQEEMGSDKSDTHIWHYGFGRTNLANFTWEPDGEAVVNQVTLAPSKGPRQVGIHSISQEAWGILENWEDAGSGGFMPQGLREAYLRGILGAYSRPLNTFTIEPVWDQGLMGSAASTPWRYPTGYQPGDRMRVMAKKGTLNKNLVGRVTKVTLTQLNAAENARTQVEMIPLPDTDLDNIRVRGVGDAPLKP